MTRRQPNSGAASLPKQDILVWLAAAGLACTLQALPARAGQQAASQGTTPQDKSQPNSAQAAKAQADKAQADKAQADKTKKDAAAPKPPAPSSSRSAYSVTNGTNTYYRIEESTRKPTKDGEVETQRVRMPSFSGDDRVVMDREVRTKNLPDGTVEKEYVTKNTDGAGHEVPIEIIRERVKKTGDKTTVERERLTPDGEGHWNTVRKEQVNETGPDAARKSVKEVLLPDSQGKFQVVDRETTTAKSTKDVQESRTVRQVPDAHGRMSDYEVKDERTDTKGGKETHQVTLSRRDLEDTDHTKLQLVDKTTEVKTTSADGKQVTTHTTKESGTLEGGAVPDVNSSKPRVVEESTEVDTKGPNGEKKVVDVKTRDAGDPSKVRPSYKVVTETDKAGNVRQVYIPADR